MRILFVDTYYSRFLESFWRRNNYLRSKSYVEIKEKILDEDFGTSDFYSSNLRDLGCETDDIIINERNLQFKWASEKRLKVNINLIRSKLYLLPLIGKYFASPDWVSKIALAQIINYKPDVVYMQDLSVLTPLNLKQIKKHCLLLVGQIACPLPSKEHLKCFDLIITSFPHYVSYFKKIGINSEYLKLAFEQKILKKIKKKDRRIYDVSFVGSFGPHHSKATKVFEEVCKYVPIHIWGQGFEFLRPNSLLRKNFHSKNCFGHNLFEIFSQSKIVLNRHIDVAHKYANNMRMYEATAMGAMLITDKKINNNDLFKVGDEIIEYENAMDLYKKIKYYLGHDEERSKIAIAGQKRTLQTHNYRIRMQELLVILNKYLKK